MSTLSFYEYLQIRKIDLPNLPRPFPLREIFEWSSSQLYRMTEVTTALIGHFHEYLVRGGFPQTALIESITQSQKLLREDIIEKVLKRDMTALFGVRRIIELELLFIYLCMHDGGLQDTATIAKELGIAKQTVHNFLDLFESIHLIYRLSPVGYGKEVLRGRNKIYLTDPAIAPAVLLKGKTVLEDAHELGQCVETAVIGHLFSHCASRHARVGYWRNHREKEVDFIAEINGTTIPFEVKYQSQSIRERDIAGLIELSTENLSIQDGYVITKNPQDIGLLKAPSSKCARIPASLFCYLLGATEFSQKNILLPASS